MAKEETPILPQAAAFLVISYLVYRIFFTSSPSNSPSSPPRSARRPDPARLRQQVEAVHGMFPQFSQAAVEAELIRNGGSIEVATERILSTGFLPEVSCIPFPIWTAILTRVKAATADNFKTGHGSAITPSCPTGKFSP
jgi:coupling of ubiquitin conjugation to ER degradation protein 1